MSNIILKKIIPALILISAASYANASYICNIAYHHSSTTMGSYGYASGSVYSGPHCTGSYERSLYLCSTGATNGSCTQSTQWHMSRSDIKFMVDLASQAAHAGHEVSLYVTTCNNGTYNCAHNIIFYGRE